MPGRTKGGTAYDLAGPEEAPVLVLIHGLGLNRRTWDAHLPLLADRYRVLTYDLGGHGESAKAVEAPSLSSLSAQLLALLDELSIARCVPVGFSLGGMINRRFAIDHPDRVAGLAIFNSPHERTPEAQALVEERAAATAAGGPGATLDATIERWFTPGFRRARPDVIDAVRGWVLANDAEQYAGHRKVLAHGVLELIRPEPPLAVPTLVVTCENDSGSTPAMTLAIASEIEGARAVIVPGLQHMGLLEAPGAFVEPLLEFLRDVIPASRQR